MRKILHIIEEFAMGGAERGLYNLLSNRSDPEFIHGIVAFKDGPMRDDFERLGVQTRVIPRRHTYDLFCFASLLREARAASLIHCRNSSSAVTLGGLAAQVARVPLVTSIHGHGMLHRGGKKVELWYAMHRRAAMTIAVSRSIGKELELRGQPGGRIRVIHNGLDLSGYRARALGEPQRRRLRQELCHGEEGPLVGCIGSLREVKGQSFLVESFKELLQEFPSARLLLAGEGPDLPRLQELAAELGIAGRVDFLGFRSDAFAVMQCLDVLAIPSRSEGISNVALEAMAFGTTVVATAVGGTPEIIEDGRNGLLVEYGDRSALSGALLKLVRDEEARRRLAAQGLARVAAEFSLERMAAEYWEVYAATALTRTR